MPTLKTAPTLASSATPAAPSNLPTVLDVEASGFGRNSYPIEVGFVLPDGHTFCTLIRPLDHWTHWDAQAAQTHNIPRLLLQQRGLSVQDVARRLNTDLRGQTVYSDGWVNDYSWIGALFDAADMTPSFRLENLRKLLTEAEAEQWHRIKAQIGAERGAQRHRASADARLLQLTYQRLRSAAPST
jgi:hypothetical protein